MAALLQLWRTGRALLACMSPDGSLTWEFTEMSIG